MRAFNLLSLQPPQFIMSSEHTRRWQGRRRSMLAPGCCEAPARVRLVGTRAVDCMTWWVRLRSGHRCLDAFSNDMSTTRLNQ